MEQKLRPIEKHFIKWYENKIKKISHKSHKFMFPNCKRCKADKETYEELIKWQKENYPNQ